MIISNNRALLRDLDAVALKQIPFASAVALTRTAEAAERALIAEMASTFDNPSPYIVRRGTFIKSANKSNLTAIVGIKNRDNGRGASPATYVKEHFFGGARNQKPFELALAGIGALPRGWKAIPGDGLKRDRYGSPDRKQLAEIIGALRSGMRSYKGRDKRMALVGYFVVAPGSKAARARHLRPGIYRRTQRGNAGALAPVFVFVQVAAYSKTLDLRTIVERVANTEFARHFDREFAKAVSGAR